ncbi:MAG: tetratricopeptide repeat protein [Acidobacteriota bacterium]
MADSVSGGLLSIGEAARILGTDTGELRRLVRLGLCQPQRRGRGHAFEFQDLVVLRAARELLEQDVPAARIRKALAALQERLDEDQPLSSLRLAADGKRVAVQEEGQSWVAETGQVLLDFDDDGVEEVEQAVRQVRLARTQDEGDGAVVAFNRGLDLEDSDLAAAESAYRQAVELDPDMIDARVNLGRLLHERGRPHDAVPIYEAALQLDEDDALLHFNLAVALEDSRQELRALTHYRRAIALDERFADAHFNLASLCEQLGEAAEALRHYREYAKLTENDPKT